MKQLPKTLKLFFLGMAMITALTLKAQCTVTQMGIDIDGEASGDNSGWTVCMPDANTMAIGAHFNDGNGNNAGHVRIYTWNGTAWTQKGNDIDGEAADDQSGFSISMPDANTVAIGGDLNDGNGISSGHVRVYTWDGSAWVQKGVDIDGEAPSDLSGWSVSMPDANTVAIGAPNNDGTASNAGHVRIYIWNGTAWVQKGSDINGETADDQSGYSVSMPDANTVAIGAISNDGTASNAGHVRIYTWNGTAWTQKGIDIDGEAGGDLSGLSVSMPNANTLAIGAFNNDGNGFNAGHVRIYYWNGTAWTQKGSDIDGETSIDQSGYSVSMPNANTISIGAQFNDGNGSNSGHVRIYTFNGTAWVQKGTDLDGEAASDNSGISISMPDSNTIAIGAHNNDGNGLNAGHVRVYKLICLAPEISVKGNNTHISIGDLTPSATDSTDLGNIVENANIKRRFRIVNSGNDTLRISSIVSSNSEFNISGVPDKIKPYDSAFFTVTFFSSQIGNRNAIITINNNDGDEAAYAFAMQAESICTGTLTFSQIGADINGEAANDQFGNSTSISADGSIVAIGANFNDGNGSQSGHVRVYKNISGTWTQLGADIDGEASSDRSGFSVSLSADGSIVAIGAPTNDGAGSNSGHVRVYKNISGTWTQLGADIDGEANQDLTGFSVSLSADGSVVAITAAIDDNSDYVKVYKYISGAWTQQGANIINLQGRSVSLSKDGSILAIGYSQYVRSGYVRVYKNISGTWTQQGGDINGEGSEDESGNSVSLSADGSIIAIGASINNGNGTGRGHVRVYKNISGTWTQLGADIDGEANYDNSGNSVSLSADGSIIAIGANSNNGNGNASGHARVYKYISGTWTQLGADIDGEAAGDASGYSVSLSADGNTLAIGAPGNNGNGSNSGHVRVYKLKCLNCNLSSEIPTLAGTYTSNYSQTAGSYVCYCDTNNKLLLAIDTMGSGAVISKDSIQLQIGSATPTFWGNAGGIISNPNGGAIFNRKWNVNPTTQPTSPVKVKFFFTQEEYDSVRIKLATMGTTITSPTQFEMYKLFTNGFGDPHASGATGVILMNGSTPGLNTWKYAALGSNHSAEFLVNSFSGGGGGAGAGAIPLPVEFLNFTARGLNKNSAILNWQTASYSGKSYFEIERSFDGKEFNTIGTMNSNATGVYQYIDNGIKTGTTKAFYRIKQLDENNESTETQIQQVQFNLQVSGINVYPNPATATININIASLFDGDVAEIAIVDALGKVVLKQSTDQSSIEINLSNVSPGIYQLVVNTKTENKSIQFLKN